MLLMLAAEVEEVVRIRRGGKWHMVELVVETEVYIIFMMPPVVLLIEAEVGEEVKLITVLLLELVVLALLLLQFHSLRLVHNFFLFSYDLLCCIDSYRKLNNFFPDWSISSFLILIIVSCCIFNMSFLVQSFVLLLIHFVFCLSAKHDILVVLGSADDRILSERVSAAMQYIQSSHNQSIILFISGGVKNALQDDGLVNTSSSEASKAAGAFSNESSYENVQIVLDENATNTAENFAYLKRWVNQNFSQDDLPSFVITTSDFHQVRAERLFHGFLPDVTPQWNLSKSSCSRCWADESIHIKNVPADILKARHIVQ